MGDVSSLPTNLADGVHSGDHAAEIREGVLMPGMPERIGRYTVASTLGSGGMGEVFLAFSPAGDPVAVKLIRADRLDPVTRERFEREARAARKVVGTGRVARFLDADPYADRPWMAMDYVPGRTLLEEIDTRGPLPVVQVASLGALLAEGLAAVHAVDLLHRDMKPQNVIMGDYGPVIIDFGLAAFTDATHESLSHSGMIVGTVRCMPPEQAAGNPHVTPAADVYALGTVLLYATAGHYPYDGTRWESIVAQVASPDHAPDLGGVPEALLPLLTAVFAHEPQDRPTVEQVAEACGTLMSAFGVTAAAARQTLIARTAGGGAGVDRLTPEVEDRLRDAAAPLPDADEIPAQPPVEEDLPEASTAEPEPPAPTAPPRPRVPASRRVAEDLRKAYAAKPVL
ncbi:serine/threonine-protein kinase [Kitasatospora sp. NPDC057692]|uniref:serine/threonine-protein kinase n=1 Tax=Kitasatospora sp. NPDC057692 TaxID=3346215 RepID=UPI0036CED21D